MARTEDREGLTIPIAEAARIAGTGWETMREAVRIGQVPSVVIGRKPRVLREPFLEMLEGRSEQVSRVR